MLLNYKLHLDPKYIKITLQQNSNILKQFSLYHDINTHYNYNLHLPSTN